MKYWYASPSIDSTMRWFLNCLLSINITSIHDSKKHQKITGSKNYSVIDLLLIPVPLDVFNLLKPCHIYMCISLPKLADHGIGGGGGGGYDYGISFFARVFLRFSTHYLLVKIKVFFKYAIMVWFCNTINLTAISSQLWSLDMKMIETFLHFFSQWRIFCKLAP